MSTTSRISQQSLGGKMTDWIRNVFLCLDWDDEDDEPVKELQIGHPTNFERRDVHLPGLDEEQQRWIRDKAIQDAKHMYEHLQPLHSSPSSQFIARPPHATSPKAATTGNLTPFPTYEQFTTLRPAPMPSMRTSQASASTMERFRTHGRKISSSLTGRGEKDAAEEMERMVPEWRVEGEVASEAGSEESRDGDSGKGMLGKI